MPRPTFALGVLIVIALVVTLAVVVAVIATPQSTQEAIAPTPTDTVYSPSTIATENAQLTATSPDAIATDAAQEASATAEAGPDLAATEQAVKAADADIATAEAAATPVDTETPIPADTQVPDTPTIDTSVQIFDTNTGNAADALIGASIKDWIARFGKPNTASGLRIHPCPDGRDFDYSLSTQSIYGAMYSADVVTPDGQATTQVVTQIDGNRCDLVGRSETALLADAAQFFPPDTGPLFATCGDSASTNYYYHSDLLTSQAEASLASPFQTDCYDRPLPDGTITVILYRDNDGQWDGTWDMNL